ncbi:MAG: universal stress protein [Syntrophobacteraceae bacterium]|nr:universal stress protein [Desulfobacteraceae bacterium]
MGYKSIVCAVSGSPYSLKAAEHAAALAKQDGASLAFVYAVDATFFPGGVGMGASRHTAEESLERIAVHILESAAEAALGQGIEPRKIARKGPVMDVLRKVVAEERADLLVLGHEHRTFFEKYLFKGDVEDDVKELERQIGAKVIVVG